MIVSRKNIPEAIKLEKARAIIEWNSHDDTRDDTEVVPSVFVQRNSFKMYRVVWCFTDRNTLVGEVKEDATSKYPEQEIVWVWDNSPINNKVYPEMKFKLMELDGFTPMTITRKDASRYMDKYDKMGADVFNRTGINTVDTIRNFISHIQIDYTDHLENLESDRKMIEFDKYVEANRQRLAEKREKRLARNKKARSSKSLLLTKNNNDTRLWA